MRGMRFQGLGCAVTTVILGAKRSSSFELLSAKKAALEIQKLEAELALLNARAELDLKKLVSDLAKINAEIKELSRPFVLRNVAPVATLVAALLGIGGTFWLNQRAAMREGHRSLHEAMAKQLIAGFGDASSLDRIAAARQFGQLDPEITFVILRNAFVDAQQGAKTSESGDALDGKAKLSIRLRAGIVEAAGHPDRILRLSNDRRRAILQDALHDPSGLVRYKAHLGLLEIQEGESLGMVFKRERALNTLTPIKDDGRVMLVVSRGIGVIGSDTNERNEMPAQEVLVETFAIDEKLVTNAMWNRVMHNLAPSFETIVPTPLGSWRMDAKNSDNPVLGVDFQQAKTFCGSTPGGRLPTEVEIEVAARGNSGWTYPWGESTSISEAVAARERDYSGNPQMAAANLNIPFKGDESIFGVGNLATAAREWTDSEYRGQYPIPYLDHATNKCVKQCVVKGAAGRESSSGPPRLLAMRMSRREFSNLRNPDDLVGFRCAKTLK